MAYADCTVAIRGIEVELQIYADIQYGGSNSHDSDEPPWAEIYNIEIYHNRKVVSKKVIDAISEKAWDSINDSLLLA